MKIAILGAGAWGTALSISLSARHEVALWARDEGQAEAIARERCNRRYLPQARLPVSIAISADLPSVLGPAELALIATPTGAMRDALL